MTTLFQHLILAQDLLSQWMEEKVNLTSGLEPEIDCTYEADGWERHELQSDVKREWDKLLADNYDDYGLQLATDTPIKQTKGGIVSELI